MNDKFLYILLLILTCLISAFSQFLLKKASLHGYKTFLRQYLNPYVIIGYILFFFVLAINIFVMKYLPVNICSAICESLPIVLSFFAGRLFFNERITVRELIGVSFIFIGILTIVL